MYLARFDSPQPARDYWASHYSMLRLLPRDALAALYSLSPAHLLAADELPANGRILDAGSGFGPVSILNPHSSNTIVGIDSSRELVRTAARLTPSSRFQVGSISALPYSSGSFDMYLAVSSLELVREGLEPPLGEAFRVLRRGGRLVMVCPRLQTDWVIDGFKRTDSTLGRLRLERLSRCPDPWPEDGYGYYYTLRELCRATRQTGFAKVRGSRTDLLGGLCYGRLMGRRLRRVLSSSVVSPNVRAAESRADRALRRLCRRLLDYEASHPAGRGPALWVGRLLWSFWNVVWATRP